jgi:hypothetical protein
LKNIAKDVVAIVEGCVSNKSELDVMKKIELPINSKYNSSARGMGGNPMLRRASVNHYENSVAEGELKKLIADLIEDNNQIGEIHRAELTDWSIILSISLSQNA